MSVVKTRYEHILLNEEKVPIIAGTKMKVIELILYKIACGWIPEELQYQHPRITLAQICPALAYYSNHQEEHPNFTKPILKPVQGDS